MFFILGGLVAIAFWASLIVGINWCLWTAWCWALPQLWVDGPVGIIQPSWALFFVACVLISWLGRMLFPNRA